MLIFAAENNKKEKGKKYEKDYIITDLPVGMPIC